MKSIYGLTNLRIKVFVEFPDGLEVKVNEFLKKHNGNIVDVMIEANGSNFQPIKAVVLYRFSEEA
ncbi:MAG: hypothetical protein IJ364_02690 [Oscillospiraceae bacterium]|nr:hypothetical protein [Oscillospiraceae bacterium]